MAMLGRAIGNSQSAILLIAQEILQWLMPAAYLHKHQLIGGQSHAVKVKIACGVQALVAGPVALLPPVHSLIPEVQGLVSCSMPACDEQHSLQGLRCFGQPCGQNMVEATREHLGSVWSDIISTPSMPCG